MGDPWLNFQYTIEFSNVGWRDNGVCSVLSISSQAIRRDSASYIVNPVRGGPVKKYLYGSVYTDPINISILLGEGARPWLQWFSMIQAGNQDAGRNVTLKLSAYGSSKPAPKPTPTFGIGSTGSLGGGMIGMVRKRLWLRWDLINCYPVSWQIGTLGVDDAPSAMKIDMTLQFDSMVVVDDDQELHEVMG